MNKQQTELFSDQPAHSSQEMPLAHRARPHQFAGYFGQEALFKKYKFLKSKDFPSIILWGPPGVGKTTLAHVLAAHSDKTLFTFSPVLAGLAELKKIIQQITEIRSHYHKGSIVFIDEIHRFNKAQQDALLPHLEKNEFILIGATTENPRAALNKALLSRVHCIELERLPPQQILKILGQCIENFQLQITPDVMEMIAHNCHGDARLALNLLELISKEDGLQSDLEKIKDIILSNAREYDTDKDRHYDVISAFIKSMRGSDPDAAIYWLAVMLDGGEDPLFIARRLIIFASEDIGNADPSALNLSVSTLQAIQHIGMPEARIVLAQAVTYLSSTYKSNASYNAINQALDYVRSHDTREVPNHLKNFPSPSGPKYKYPHNYQNNYVSQHYTCESTPHFYQPKGVGKERALKEHLSRLKEQH